MVVRSIKLLFDGYFELDMGMLVYGKTPYYGIKYQAALKPLLVQTDSDNILIDTGIGMLPEKHQQFYKVHRGSGEDLTSSLKEAGLSVQDISMVINTHLHVDHCGNNRIFDDARFIVQKTELDYAYNPHRFQKGGYLKDMFESINFETIKGNVEIVPGIFSLLTSGHTPGHQSIVLKLTDTGSSLKKRYVYCGDEAPLEENLQKKNITGILYDQVQSLNALEVFSGMDAEFIYSHDRTQMQI
jgi:glyoxylase-like metal-dependent hydrolase (beta-lactamase superfamily II)